MITYPFRQGIDYRRRTKGPPLGLEFHMTEGNGGYGDVVYLMKRVDETVDRWHERVSGVSASVVIIDDGTTYQMVDFNHVNGNLNPADRAGEYGYYGHSKLVDVLGDSWPDPNQRSLSAEIAGKRADGPTDAQVRAAITWGLDMRVRFPTLRGAYGHHDQSTKACPGLTANMKAIFAGVGGHGLWTEEPMTDIPVAGAAAALVDLPPKTRILNPDGSYRFTDTVGHTDVLSPFASVSPGGTAMRSIVWDRGAPAPDLLLAVYTNAVKNVRPVVRPADPRELVDAKAAEHELVRAAAIAAAEAL